MSAPHYYRLASGREFCDFCDHELWAWLESRVSAPVYHCIISAMEHRFRRGKKEGQEEHDRKAETWWTERAEWLHILDCEGQTSWETILGVVRTMVDAERMELEKGNTPL